MAIAVSFTPASMSAEQYDEIIKRLEATDNFPSPELLYHVCYGSSNQLFVLDVWDSPEAFDEFGKTLMPILQDMGLDPGEPSIREVHNIIKG